MLILKSFLILKWLELFLEMHNGVKNMIQIFERQFYHPEDASRNAIYYLNGKWCYTWTKVPKNSRLKRFTYLFQFFFLDVNIYDHRHDFCMYVYVYV